MIELYESSPVTVIGWVEEWVWKPPIFSVPEVTPLMVRLGLLKDEDRELLFTDGALTFTNGNCISSTYYIPKSMGKDSCIV